MYILLAGSFTSFNVLLLTFPAASIDLQPSSNVWYDILKDKISHQQSKPVWVSEVTVRHAVLCDTHIHLTFSTLNYFSQ